MSLYDEISIFWGLLIFIICISIYILGYVLYKLGYRDGEQETIKKIERKARQEVQRRIKRLQ